MVKFHLETTWISSARIGFQTPHQEKLTESVDTLTKQGRACPRWLSGIPRLAKELVKYANGMGQLLDNLHLFYYDRFFSDVWFCMSCFVLSTMVNW